MHEELREHGFTVITVALDRSAEDVRPYIEAAAPTHPSLIDTEHILADLYGILNVPTGIWIDEIGHIVRPNQPVFGSDAFIGFHGIPSGPHFEALRAWVKENQLPPDSDTLHSRRKLPTPEEQLARTELGLAWHLHQQGRIEAAERHFVRAGELAPHDWTIRRGSMPIRGLDPMGPAFAELYAEFVQAGRSFY